MSYQGHEMYDAHTTMGDAYDAYQESMKHPDLDKYEVTMSEGITVWFYATSATDAKQQAEQAWPELTVLSCREVAIEA